MTTILASFGCAIKNIDSTLFSFVFITNENNFHGFINNGKESLENLQFFLYLHKLLLLKIGVLNKKLFPVRPNRFTIKSHRKLD